MPSSLPISRLINVQVNLTPSAAQSQDLSTLLVLGSSSVIDVVERIRTYDDLSSIATEFGTTAPEYLAAALWFEQAPQPTQIMLGRWAQTAAAGLLRGATVPAVDQAIASWNAITSGGFTVTVDGGAAQNITGLNFSAQTNLNGVATIINAAFTGADIFWDAVNQRFYIESDTTGAASTVSFLTAPGSGTDISTKLAMRSTSSGAYVADGIAAETAVTAATLFETDYSQQWYALMMPTITDNDDHLAVAEFLQGTDTKHIYGATTQEAGAISSVSTVDLAYLMSEAGYSRTMVQYSSSNAYAVASLLGRALTVDYNANGTVITLMYKQEPGITAETLTSTQMSALIGKNVNVFVNYNNDTAIIEPGVMSSSDFIDIITGTDWLAVALQTAEYNALYTSPTRIPQTDDGMTILANVARNTCSQAVANGLVAAGTWDSAGFGMLKNGDYMSAGFYVYVAPVSTQSAADRAARRSMPIQVAVKLAGAVHSVDVIVTVNR